MQRRVPLALILSTLLVSSVAPSLALAQEGAAGIGEPVTVTDPEGIVRGSVTIKELTDPFAAHDESYPPPEGMRYVLLNATFEAAPDQSLDAQPYHVVLQDGDGILYTTQWVPRPAEAVSQVPDFQGRPMSPGDRSSGAIGYVLPTAAILDRIVYQPATDRLVELVDLLPGSGPALGDPVAYTDATGASATISAQLVDPFTAFDPAYPPTEGTRFVALHPVVENTGQLPYYADPYDLVLADTTGRLYTNAYLYQAPGFSVAPFESQTMNPGDRISGLIGYAVPEGAELADILYYPEWSRIVSLGDLEGGQSQPSEPTAGVESPAPGAAEGSSAPDASAGTGR